MSLSAIVARIRSLFAPRTTVAAPAPAPKPRVYASIYRTRGNKRRLVGGGWVDRAATGFDTAVALQLSGFVHAGESVEIDGERWRIRADAAPALMDPARRNAPGDRERHRRKRGERVGIVVG